ncbi:MAG: motility protein A [Candidatus Loosdrechtia sp.]|uniref:motility protein A n=1 Tax=Candidatus Loosdrechtia sp. TaxID=3101272 RepID=UPI003A6CDC70|nr:MAG: motility protein A [Candidatus Jettenia sp. AMX2]
MDIATPAGLLIGFVLLIISIVLGGGFSGVIAFLNIPSILIVAGGTVAATLIRFPLTRVTGLVGLMMKTLFVKVASPQVEMKRMIEFAKLARREGLLSLESKIDDSKDAFLSKSIQLMVDGTDADSIRQILEKEIDYLKNRHSIGRDVLSSMGTVSPAFGMMGTLIGLILMLRELDDPSQIGVGMATALITTFYGVLLANLIFLPMAGKLDIRSKEETLVKELIVEGVVSIQSGDNPTIVEEKLKGFLSPAQRKQMPNSEEKKKADE